SQITMCVITLISLLFALIATPTNAQFNQRNQVDQTCITPDNYYGSCVPLTYCPQVVNIFQNNNQNNAQRYVIGLHRICGTRNVNNDPVVCCTAPRINQYTERPPPNPFLPTEGNSFVGPQPPPPLPSPPPPPETDDESQNPFFPRPTATTTVRTVAPVPFPTAEPLNQDRGLSCRGPDIKPGSCIDIESCPSLINQLKEKQSDPTFIKFLRASRTICGNKDHQVCCPYGRTTTTPKAETRPEDTDDVPHTLPTMADGCGTVNRVFKKIVGGVVSRKGSWPWIALLGYDTASGSPFRCGGTLITARHVLTAAHCVLDDLSFVRLGEYDLSTDTETPHVDINVTRYVAHPDYSRWNGRSDLAMLYLERNVEFTKTILPICLPKEDNLRHKSYVDYWPFVAGWGKLQEGGEEATVLNELRLPVQKNEVCLEKYREQKRYRNDNQFDSAVLCAGELTGGKDTCQGDSGGPLMVNELYQNQVRFYLIGVVSYGIGCARKDVPGVYASTQYFMDWIIARVQEAP
ncbi:hypothetical protein KR018_009656, partial [Drosophila ironensis]